MNGQPDNSGQQFAGMIRSDKKKIVSQLRALRENLFYAGEERSKQEKMTWLLDRIQNRGSMAADLLNKMDIALAVDPHNIKAIDTYNRIMSTLHGTKLQMENTNININIDMTNAIDEVYAHIKTTTGFPTIGTGESQIGKTVKEVVADDKEKEQAITGQV